MCVPQMSVCVELNLSPFEDARVVSRAFDSCVCVCVRVCVLGFSDVRRNNFCS